jgi:formylglycine-generating enzyme required for sulfatase activity
MRHSSKEEDVVRTYCSLLLIVLSATAALAQSSNESMTVAAGSVREDSRAPGLAWAFIPAGTFQMGCVPGDTECQANEKPRHAVTLTTPFELMTTEVTVGMFEAYAAATGQAVPAQPDGSRSDQHPVVNVTWDEARAFCGWVGGRLPTEAEWEHAARAGTTTVYWWGDTFEVYRGHYAEGRAVAVGDARRTNPWGLSDMLGNVSEWTADGYDADAYRRGAATDPTGPPLGDSRVVRGGFWYFFPRSLRVSNRSNTPPSDYFHGIGVRCARDVFP